MAQSTYEIELSVAQVRELLADAERAQVEQAVWSWAAALVEAHRHSSAWVEDFRDGPRVVVTWTERQHRSDAFGVEAGHAKPIRLFVTAVTGGHAP